METFSVQMNTNVTPSFKKRIALVAQACGVSRGEFIRSHLTAAMDAAVAGLDENCELRTFLSAADE